ncbi:hypothetical protein BWI96_19360 [Siphonobacter sp. SORGH_AS_0500]|uniref:SRPBCC family protein n=1 Tax=Siphonobacter sp. SORGH_AS_0500 TaxID=1864824 RepID=UPI000CC3D38B|nr:SRPBCC family protein [Siphonobacter sp. SORGH_AS_0500]PKK34990.1 hypothetical protein BWI96_19360 [Siphonobacter sp. SORGH_AS_0500]
MNLIHDYSFEKERLEPIIRGSGKVNIGSTERMVSAFGGALLTTYAFRKPLNRWAALGAGAYLLFRGLSGYCPVNKAVGRNTAESNPKPLTIKRSLTINRPRADVYAYWRQLENLPSFMQHLSRVTVLDSHRSHWEAPLPGGVGFIEWDADITGETEGEWLRWQSVAEASVDHVGEVYFADAPGDRGTEVHVHITYQPPVGYVGHALAGWLNPAFEQMVKEDIRRFKQFFETGELPVSEAHPSGKSVTGSPSTYQTAYESPML